MSKPLVNEFSWSPSRDRLFQSCQRAYYFCYYGSWGGWDASAPERTRLIYMLKNLQTLALWGGSIVHDVIKTYLSRARSDQMPFSVGELQEAARQLLRRGWVESAKGAWQSNPKRAVHLFEHYYGDGTNRLPAEQTEALKQRVFEALESFCNSETVAELLALPYANWKSIDVLNSFQPEGVDGEPLKVWSAIDLAYVDCEGMLHIVDWKTGAEHREELVRQLQCYALYAMQEWRTPLERLRLEGVFLNDGGLRKPFHPTPESLAMARKYIGNSAKAMRARLRDADANTAAEEDFPPTGVEKDACRTCPYRQLCSGEAR